MPRRGGNWLGAVDPSQPVEWEHPLARGLTGLWLPLPQAGFKGADVLRDLTRPGYGGNHGTLANGASWAGGPFAPVVACTGTTHRVTLGASTAVLPGAADMTVLLYHRKQDGTNRASNAVAADGGGRFCVFLPFSDGVTYLDWNGASSGTTRVSASITPDTQWHAWGFSVGGGLGMRIYRDGRLRASNAATPSRTVGGNVALNYGAPANGDLADFGMAATFDRAISADAQSRWAELAFRGLRGPDSPLRWVSTRTYFVPSGGAASPGFSLVGPNGPAGGGGLIGPELVF